MRCRLSIVKGAMWNWVPPPISNNGGVVASSDSVGFRPGWHNYNASATGNSSGFAAFVRLQRP